MRRLFLVDSRGAVKPPRPTEPKARREPPPQNRLIFNYASLGVLAASGLLMNLLVVRLAGEAALGVFNQALAIYIAASQLAFGGVHISVLRSVAQPADSAEQSAVIASCLALTFGLGCAVAALAWLTRGFWAWALDSQPVSDSLAFVAPARVLRPQQDSARYLQWTRANAGFCRAAGAALRDADFRADAARRTAPSGAHLAAALLISEICVTLAASVCLAVSRPVRISSVRQAWIRHHHGFSARGLLSGVFIERALPMDRLKQAASEVQRRSVCGHFRGVGPVCRSACSSGRGHRDR
jgi:hypothetical protein